MLSVVGNDFRAILMAATGTSSTFFASPETIVTYAVMESSSASLIMIGTDCEVAPVCPSLVTMDITVLLMGAVMQVYRKLAFAVATETCTAVISASNWLMTGGFYRLTVTNLKPARPEYIE